MTRYNNSTALFVDTYSRQLMVSTVSVTEVPGKGLVLRFGAELGPLWQLTQNGELKPDLPILISASGYSAQSSAGFVEVVVNSQGRHPCQTVIGIQGMPWQKKSKALRIADFGVYILRPGTNVIPHTTHSKGRGGHSNPATAEAALKGLHLRVQGNPHEVILAEGQSDYVQAWRLVGYYTLYQESWQPEWDREHRSERFNDEALFAAKVRAHARKSFAGEDEATPEKISGAVLINLVKLSAWPEDKGTIWDVVPQPVQELASKLLAEMREEGWRLLVDQESANHFLQAFSPKGEEVVVGWALCHGSKEYEAAMIAASDNSAESKVELLAQLENQDPESRGWLNRIGA